MRSRPCFHALAAALVGFTVIGAAAALSAGITGPSKGDPAAGKKIFVEKCIACHKADGSGGVKLTGNPTPDWRDAKRLASLGGQTAGAIGVPAHEDDYLRNCITHGRPKSGMVAWSKQGMKPAQIENLIAYIHTFSALKKELTSGKK